MRGNEEHESDDRSPFPSKFFCMSGEVRLHTILHPLRIIFSCNTRVLISKSPAFIQIRKDILKIVDGTVRCNFNFVRKMIRVVPAGQDSCIFPPRISLVRESPTITTSSGA